MFLKQGYQAFSLRQVAEQIGYSPGTIYLYFEDKDAVLYAIMDEGAQLFSQYFKGVPSQLSAAERLAALGRAYIAFGTEHPAHYQLMFMQRTDYLARLDGVLPPAFVEVFGMWLTTVAEAMKVGALRLRDPSSTSDALWALMHGVVSLIILMPNFDAKRIHDLKETAIEMLMNGLHQSNST